MRFRIALATALAVTVTPALFLTLFTTTPAGSAGSAGSAQQAAIAPFRATSRPVELNLNLMSYAQAEKVSRLVTYAQAVELQKEEGYLRYVSFMNSLAEVTYLKAVSQTHLQQATARAATPPTTPAPQVQPAALPAPAVGGSDATSTNTADWACIRQHESGGNYSEGGGGAYQFEFGTWSSLTGLPAPAQDYPPSVQDAAALKLYAERGFEPWTTRYVCGI